MARFLSADVERILLRRIAEGRYKVGDRLPSCEQFGREIGANKNTVSKAYRALGERGYVTARAGRGTFVTARPATPTGDGFRQEVGSLLTLVVESAYSVGLSLEELEQIVGEEIRRRYDRSGPRVAFIDCNLAEATRFSRELEKMLRTPVEPVLLDDLFADIHGLTNAFDIIALDLSHLADTLEQLRSATTGNAEIVPLLTLPDPASLVKIAGLAPETRIGLLTETPEALSALKGFVHAYNPSLDLATALVRDTGDFARVVDDSDVLLITEAVHLHLGGLLKGTPLIEAHFLLDSRSVALLGEQVARRRLRVAAALPRKRRSRDKLA